MSSYKAIAASQTGAIVVGEGQVGQKGDILRRMIVNVATAATSTVAILDGSTSISLVPADATIGTYSLDLDLISQTGAWTVTTGAGVSVIVVGDYS